MDTTPRFVLGVCDKMLVGSLRDLVEADLARQTEGPPVYAAFLPTAVGREVHLGDEELRKFESFRERLTETEAAELFPLLRLPIKPQVYEALKACLDHFFHSRTILESEKHELERLVSRAAAASTANCVSSDASIVNRLMLATFGLVARHMELRFETARRWAAGARRSPAHTGHPVARTPDQRVPPVPNESSERRHGLGSDRKPPDVLAEISIT